MRYELLSDVLATKTGHAQSDPFTNAPQLAAADTFSPMSLVIVSGLPELRPVTDPDVAALAYKP